MLLRCLPLAVFFLFLILFIAGQAQHRLNFLCDSHTNLDNESESRGGHKYLSCVAKRKLKLLVIEYGFVDAMTGAANRHLGLLTVLGSLGHTIKRASLRVGMTKKLPPLAKGVFEGMHIEQHPKTQGLLCMLLYSMPLSNKACFCLTILTEARRERICVCAHD